MKLKISLLFLIFFFCINLSSTRHLNFHKSQHQKQLGDHDSINPSSSNGDNQISNGNDLKNGNEFEKKDEIEEFFIDDVSDEVQQKNDTSGNDTKKDSPKKKQYNVHVILGDSDSSSSYLWGIPLWVWIVGCIFICCCCPCTIVIGSRS
uniref:Transmembrane protein n=1 Tax=Panagrolaimus sp. ES5 TaxID=591445 RepID=A0AC34GEC5_9BILA